MSEKVDSGFEAALAGLRQTVSRKRKPSRYEARAVLVALGERLEREPELEAELARRIEETVGSEATSWEAAVREELQLACEEHVRGADPRYLPHPRYDFGYALEARRKLAARIRAASALGLGLDPSRSRSIEQADDLLARHLPPSWREHGRRCGLPSAQEEA